MTLMMRILVKMIISIIHYNCISQTWGDLDLPYVCHLKINIGRGTLTGYNHANNFCYMLYFKYIMESVHQQNYISCGLLITIFLAARG